MPVISVVLHLGYGFFRATLTYPFRVGKGKDRFLGTYAAEGLVPVSADYRTFSPGFERCIGCGFCELGLARPLELGELASSSWRSPETWPALSELLDALAGMDLERVESMCPASVPLKALVLEFRTLLRKWAEIEGGVPQAATSDDIRSTIESISEAEP